MQRVYCNPRLCVLTKSIHQPFLVTYIMMVIMGAKKIIISSLDRML